MPVAALAVVAAAAAIYSGVEANQQQQHAKGAAEAQATAADAQIADQTKKDETVQQTKGANATTTQSAAIKALRASMSANSAFGGSILTGSQGTGTAAPTTTKSLLGA